jgi:hypothetical protein
MVCQGAEGREEAHGVLGVTRDLVVMMLTMAGVTPAPVVDGKQRRKRRGQAVFGSWALASVWDGSG